MSHELESDNDVKMFDYERMQLCYLVGDKGRWRWSLVFTRLSRMCTSDVALWQCQHHG
jgi:hypothetical protein